MAPATSQSRIVPTRPPLPLTAPSPTAEASSALTSAHGNADGVAGGSCEGVGAAARGSDGLDSSAQSGLLVEEGWDSCDGQLPMARARGDSANEMGMLPTNMPTNMPRTSSLVQFNAEMSTCVRKESKISGGEDLTLGDHHKLAEPCESSVEAEDLAEAYHRKIQIRKKRLGPSSASASRGGRSSDRIAPRAASKAAAVSMPASRSAPSLRNSNNPTAAHLKLKPVASTIAAVAGARQVGKHAAKLKSPAAAGPAPLAPLPAAQRTLPPRPISASKQHYFSAPEMASAVLAAMSNSSFLSSQPRLHSP